MSKDKYKDIPHFWDISPQENILRDTFAIHAAAGLLARRAMDPAEAARLAYAIADAMMIERVK